MKLLPVTQTNLNNSPSFRSKPDINSEILSGLTEDVMKELTNTLSSKDAKNKIKAQLSNPQQKKVFFAAVASLITAAAAQITEILTGENTEKKVSTERAKKVTTASGDVFETKSNGRSHSIGTYKIYVIKHRGMQAEHEVKLLNSISDISKKLQLQGSESNEIIKLYNKFCGINYKGSHDIGGGRVCSNIVIAESLIAEFTQCKTVGDLHKIIEKYNSFTAESKPLSTDVHSKNKTIGDEVVAELIKPYSHLARIYPSIMAEDKNGKKIAVINAFIKSINNDSHLKSVKNILFSRTNSNYNEKLYELASIYLELEKSNLDAVNKFTSMIGNRGIAVEALEKWSSVKSKYQFDFFEYNSMVKNGVDDDTIDEIALHKRNTKFNKINVIDSEKFTITPPFLYINKNFYLINNIFKLLHKNDDFVMLQSKEPEIYTIFDIESEILKHIDSYPNMRKHLAVKDKDYFNRGKMQNLLNLYNGSTANKNLFTMHSYLRFMERVVIPSIKENFSEEEANYCSTINKNYILKVKELRQSINNVFVKRPIEVRTYSCNNIKAPQFMIPMMNKSGVNIVITINNDNKIHTIF